MVKGHTEIRIKRVYDPPDEADGTRALVDRLWPRGLRKENAVLTLWLKRSRRVRPCANGSSKIRRTGRSSAGVTAPSWRATMKLSRR
jgi:hypothetical protein